MYLYNKIPAGLSGTYRFSAVTMEKVSTPPHSVRESAQHASHMNNQILSPHSNTLRPRALSLLHFLLQFVQSINNSASDKMGENDGACFLFMVGRHSVQLNVETAFFRFPFHFWIN